ncbi:Nitrogen fixation protein NifW [Trichormus variabilis ATCC 29413]|uniref:Nitrogenase-stabilizing/protective protein NifW 2 n=2 Tax=Anabaena variabilis TaxID=264691 RepID=NIFW2_TRIV2|nr:MULTISPECIES: nitrogenase-stabilizing/protective protein NifW [Nostocaceae]P46054.2 RecName: Full=Nitrogenase-stabilizing/protective protein NifW 2 [Trichormus variabilis ATCC 29413]AAA93028.1 NifW2 [Trichormus variabilis ATCC 29413]ABA23854.1 Nitrogen fixation protein NifW [Trichormus variabilis ATCC 29413]MBC1214467.1 nitrogenase-stabilizing/protective protein NifW [Trichormus variabilis ARAD]MBC1256230.1 nitrogenase-stabilizing/protective protein NifW [Trichormus variabilis V5]MBC126868
MTWDIEQFNKLVSAEEYFEFFQLPYDPRVVQVSRLHILKQFSQSIQEIDANNSQASQAEKLDLYCTALKQAYEVFLSSTPLEQKLFKVFKQKPKNIVMLTEIATS